MISKNSITANLDLSKFKHLFFDLDGTLTESHPGIINSVKYALEHFGIEETDNSKLQLFIGPPLVWSFMNYYGFSEEKAREAMKIYRERFGKIGLYENAVYDGIKTQLENLKSAGKKLYVATSKPEIYMTKILDHFDLRKYFESVAGSDIEETRSQKWQVISYVINQNNLSEDVKNGTVIMIGDRMHDIDGAAKNGIPSLGVLWGYGSKKELEEHKSTYIIENVKDLSCFIQEKF